MFALVYVSSATHLFSNEELEELLAVSRRNNTAVGVTGMLLYKEGNFMQFLEGPKDEVMTISERIGKDPRHRGMLTLMKEEQPEREFSEWAMGFKRVDGLEPGTPGYSDFLDLPAGSEQFRENPSKCLKLLMNFRKIMR